MNPVVILPAPDNDPELAHMQKLVTGALNEGYVPLAYEMRSGERTAGWYRGPLLPVRTKPAQSTAPARAPFESAEAALIYDSRTGMLDVSYAVAWQIGRLLALSSPQFASSLSRWRQQGQVLSDRLLQAKILNQQFREEQLFITLDEVISADETEQRQKLIDLVHQLADSKAYSKALANLFAPSAAPSPIETLKAAPLGKARLTRGLRDLTPDELAILADIPAGVERATKMAEFQSSPPPAAPPVIPPAPTAPSPFCRRSRYPNASAVTRSGRSSKTFPRFASSSNWRARGFRRTSANGSAT